MRILMLTQTYLPTIGGIEHHVRNLSIELAARGHEVSIATLWQSGLAEYELDQGIRVRRMRGTMHRASRFLFANPERVYAIPLPDPEVMWNLRGILHQERPQIVHAHNWLVHSFLPLKRWSGAQLVVTLHDYELQCPKWTYMYRDRPCSGPGLVKCLDCAAGQYGRLKAFPTVLATPLARAAEQASVDIFLPVSTAVAVGNGLNKGHVPFQVIPNFLLDEQPSSALDLEQCLVQLPPERFLIFVGAFGRHKGVDVLLDAYSGIPNAPPLVLIGYETSGYELPACPNVIVLRNLPRAAVMEALRRSSLALIPSVCPDSCPTVAMEAMAAGCPVIASRVGGLPDLVDDGVTGILVPPSDSLALREAIQLLLNDVEMQQRMSAKARQKVTEFMAEKVVPRIERVYGQLIQDQVHAKPIASQNVLPEC